MTDQERSDELYRLRAALHIAAHGDDEESARALGRAIASVRRLLADQEGNDDRDQA